MNIDEYIELIKSGKILSERDMRLLCEHIKDILVEESNCHPVSSPVTVCGDIHG